MGEGSDSRHFVDVSKGDWEEAKVEYEYIKRGKNKIKVEEEEEEKKRRSGVEAHCEEASGIGGRGNAMEIEYGGLEMERRYGWERDM